MHVPEHGCRRNGGRSLQRLENLGNEDLRREVLRFDAREVSTCGEQARAKKLLADGVAARDEHSGPPERQELAYGVVTRHRDDDVRPLVVRREVGLEVDELDIGERTETLQDRSTRSLVHLRTEDHGGSKLDPAGQRAQPLEVRGDQRRAVGAATCRDECVRWTVVRRGHRRGPPQVPAEARFAGHVVAKRVLDDRIEDGVFAVDPHLVVVPRDRGHVVRAPERSARALGLVEDVAHAKDQAGRGRPAAQCSQRIEQLAGDAAGPLVDDHQIGLEANDRLDKNGPPDAVHLGRLGGKEFRLVAVGIRPIEARELDVVDTLRDTEGMDHGRTGDNQDGGMRVLTGELLGQEQRAPNVSQSVRVMRVQQELGA